MARSSSKPRPRRRWFQWSLRTMILVVTSAAVLLAVWRSYVGVLQEERRIRDELVGLGAIVETEAAGPGWLRAVGDPESMRHVVAVEWVPASERWWRAMGTPEQVPLATAREWPRCLDRDGKRRVVELLLKLDHLRRLRLRRAGLTLADAEVLAERHPDVDLDIAPAEALYHQSWQRYLKAEATPAQTAYCFRAAAEWRLARATPRSPREVELAALGQLVRWCEKLVHSEEALDRDGVAGGSRSGLAVARASLADAKIRLALARQDQNAALQAHRAFIRDNAEARQVCREALGGGVKERGSYIYSLELFTQLDLEAARLTGDTQMARQVLRDYIADLEHILSLPEFPMPSLAPDDGHILASLLKDDAEVRHEEVISNQSRTAKRLAQAASAVPTMLDDAVESLHKGYLEPEWCILCIERGTDTLEKAARALKDRDAEQDATALRVGLLAGLSLRYSRDGRCLRAPCDIEALRRCSYATARLESEGADFLKRPADDRQWEFERFRLDARVILLSGGRRPEPPRYEPYPLPPKGQSRPAGDGPFQIAPRLLPPGPLLLPGLWDAAPSSETERESAVSQPLEPPGLSPAHE
jgi:hypothetical protein